MNMVKKYWSDVSAVAISEEAIRALHSPQHFKIYANTYAAGTTFSTKAGHAFDLYVLAGSCKTTKDGSDVTLLAGEFFTLEKGSYVFAALGREEVKLVKVFSLP